MLLQRNTVGVIRRQRCEESSVNCRAVICLLFSAVGDFGDSDVFVAPMESVDEANYRHESDSRSSGHSGASSSVVGYVVTGMACVIVAISLCATRCRPLKFLEACGFCANEDCSDEGDGGDCDGGGDGGGGD